MDKSSIASAIFAAYPQNFKEQIAGVDVSELSAKYKLKPAGKNQVYNVTVRIKQTLLQKEEATTEEDATL